MDIKVNNLQGITNTEGVKQNDTGDNSDFKFTLLGKIGESQLQDKLKSMIGEINEQGDKIAKHMDISDIKKYRELVKGFLNEVVSNSHEFSRENFLDKRGRHRVYGIVKLVDKNIDELAQELIQEEKNQINILSKIDEVKGLLLDLVI